MFFGSLLYLCAVVAFVFALIASLETNGLFLSEMFATWLASALSLGAGAGLPWRPMARRSAQDRPRPARSSITRLSDCPRGGRTFNGSVELESYVTRRSCTSAWVTPARLETGSASDSPPSVVT